MDVRITKQYTLVLTPEEFRLVSKALRGHLSIEEGPKAEALQIKMQRARHATLQQELAESQKTIDNIDAAAEEP